MGFDQDMQGLRGRVDHLNHDADHLREKVTGGRVASVFDMDIYVKGNLTDNVLGNYIFKVDGSSNKVQLGASHNFTALNKSEGILGVSTGNVFVTDYKKVTGTSYTRISGAKKETVNGAKWDELHGTKFESKKSQTIT